MSDPKPEEAQLTNLSDDYIRELEPENQRYDITLAQDFVISVLPNGIKTWAFIYDFQGRHRRKTLGVFPEMNFDDAKVALEKARASMLRMDEPTVAPNEFGQLPAVLGGSNYSPKRDKKSFKFGFWMKLLGGLLALALIAFAGMKTLEWRSQQASQQVSEPEGPAMPFAITEKSAAQTPPAETVPAEPDAGRTTTPESTTNSTTSPASAPDPEPVAATPAPSSQTQTTLPAAPPPARTTAQTTASAPPPSPSTTPASTPAATSNESAPVTALTTTTNATAFGGRVARSRLTSRVQDLEPTDTLGPEISYKNSGFTRVFYFTELREFGDGNVVHRWSLNGKVHEEVVLKVNQSWRWRTYSNKDITPGLNGEWKVETIDATGKILDTEMFTYDYQ